MRAALLHEVEPGAGPEPVAGDVELGLVDPVSLRAMDRAELDALAARIRSFLVDAVSVTGGHLGSNLGVVELTLALHRVFDSPNDPIVWDTGHQAYVHKLVTGRGKGFATLRQGGGMSGYPNRLESAHDLVENSHASTALSYADGLARAATLTGRPGTVVAVVGDGALTGGLAYEALNNIGMTGTRMVVVVNDNGRSYAPTVSRLTTAAAGADGALGRRPVGFYRSLGFDYRGPVDGHDVEAVEAALREAAAATGPVIVHVHTVKGRGYEPAEHDEEKCLHDVAPFDPASGRPKVAPTGPSYTRAFTAALLAAAEQRPDLVAITAAMPGATGLRALGERYPDRVFDVGIAEQHAVTMAAGMAMAGLRPVVAVYSTFLNRAWDQLYFDVGLHRLPVVFCIDRAGITGEDGPSHHGLLDLALLTKVPGMTVLAPSCVEDLPVMLEWGLGHTAGPVAIRWPKSGARTGTPGRGLRATRLRRGRDVCLLGVGRLLGACLEAACLLEAAGMRATVWDVRAASPLDPAMVADALGHPTVVVAEDGLVEGGVGAAVASALRDRSTGIAPTVLTAGVPREYVPHGKADDILALFGLDGPGIAARVLERSESPPVPSLRTVGTTRS
jgi:1-deoxy-D-xylulose-5-phosphate synthase